MVVTSKITVDSRGDCDIVGLTVPIAEALRESGLSTGTVTVFVTGTTAAVSVMEMEGGLLKDYAAFWERAAPQDMEYDHHLGGKEDNGHAHVRAMTLGPSLVIPFIEARLTLGTWQHIILVDFDTRPRSREVVLQIMGE